MSQLDRELVSLMRRDRPVILPPGLRTLATWLLPIGSAWLAKMIGIVDVARLAASV